MKLTRQHFDNAIARISRPHGWCKHYYYKKRKEDYANCAVGALHHAVISEYPTLTFDLLRDMIRQLAVPTNLNNTFTHITEASLIVFNDECAMTKKDVIKVLEEIRDKNFPEC